MPLKAISEFASRRLDLQEKTVREKKPNVYTPPLSLHNLRRQGKGSIYSTPNVYFPPG